MRSSWLWPCVLVLFCLPLNRANAQDSYAAEFDRGMKAYKDSRIEEAIEHFIRATKIDPGKIDAHLYLAASYEAWYAPGLESKDNLETAGEAIKEYQFVLKLDPPRDIKNESLKAIATMHFNLRKWDEARKYYQMASDQAPNDPENYYAIGAVDWWQCYAPRMEARKRLGMRPDQHLSSKNPAQKKICQELRTKNSTTIEDAISKLGKAIELRPDYDDAMAYMDLMYREQADLDCDDPKVQAKDLKTAADWKDKDIGTVKEKEANPRDTPSVAGQRLHPWFPLPPPPPPPPPPPQ